MLLIISARVRDSERDRENAITRQERESERARRDRESEKQRGRERERENEREKERRGRACVSPCESFHVLINTNTNLYSPQHALEEDIWNLHIFSCRFILTPSQ